MVPGSGTKLIVRDVKREIETAFLDYSMSVIVSRALPDVRDGLKPVHRRILYTMHERGNDPSHPYRKSADTVGAVLGSYHPHGDASVYDAMVRLAQDFSLRYPLVDGQGNFGSVDGDPPAAYRYTEARMSKMAVEMLTDIDKETIDWTPNFDETKKEPSVLPCRFPNLLCNGSQGIAVGMATNIPPHNLCEVVDGLVCLIDNPDAEMAELMEHIKGPDFPTGGIIMGRSGIRAAYATGRGKITLRGRAEIEEKKNGRTQIVITEIPYMVNKARMIGNMADLVKDKRIEGIADITDESNRKGMRIVVDLKKEANAQVVLNRLYQYTQLQDTVGVIMIALDNGAPKVMSLKTMLERYLEFQDEVIRRRTQFDLKKAEERAHILEGLARAVDMVDEIIAAIRACKGGKPEAKAAIMEQFGFDDPQATAIVNFQLGQLAGLEILKIENEMNDLHAKIKDWRELLADDAKVLALVKQELLAMKQKYGDARRTEIAAVSGEVDIEDLIPQQDCVYLLTHCGYIKRQPVDTYTSQRRGGKGKMGLTTRDEDFVEELFIGSTHDYMMFVTNFGRIYRVKGYEIPESGRTAKGTNLVNLLPLAEGEKVQTMLKIPAESDEGYLVMVTKKGIIKRTPLSSYRNIRKSGLIAVTLDEGDTLSWTRITDGGDELIVATREGKAIRFAESDVRVVGRTARGVKALTLAEGDEVVGMAVAREGGELLTVTEGGKGRRTPVDDYRLQNRGGQGIKNYDCADGKVAGVKVVSPEDDIILISLTGIIIRMHVADISVQSRYAGGVKVMTFDDAADKVVTVARTPREEAAPETGETENDAEDGPDADAQAPDEPEESETAPENDGE